MTIDFNLLRKHIVHREAQERFIKGFEIYVNFKPVSSDYEPYYFFRLNPLFSFDKNIQIIKEKFKSIEGKLTVFSSSLKYPKEEITPNSKHKQLEMFT